MFKRIKHIVIMLKREYFLYVKPQNLLIITFC